MTVLEKEEVRVGEEEAAMVAMCRLANTGENCCCSNLRNSLGTPASFPAGPGFPGSSLREGGTGPSVMSRSSPT